VNLLCFSFNTIDALKGIDNSNTSNIKVHYSDVWSSSNIELVNKLKESAEMTSNIKYDWTFTTNYQGSIEKSANKEITTTTERINFGKLRRVDIPIVFYDEFVLFEDELADNGIAQCKIRVRVMPSYFLCLMRFFLRVDGVMFRVYDTRIYYEFPNNYFLREYRKKEEKYDIIAEMEKNHSVDSGISREDYAAELVPTIYEITEKIFIK